MKRLTFGLSAAVTTAEEIRRAAKFPGFSFLELPGSILDSPLLREAVADAGTEIEIRDIADPATFRQIAGGAPTQLAHELERHFRRRLACARELGIRRFSIDPDFEAAAADPAYAASAVRLLRILGAMLPMMMMRSLRLRARLPHGGAAGRPESLWDFRKNLGLPVFGILCELHPHEAGAFAAAEKFLSRRGESGEWRISFEPAAGNRLTAAPLRQLLTAAAPMAPEGLRVTFAPEPAAVDTPLAAELQQLARELE